MITSNSAKKILFPISAIILSILPLAPAILAADEEKVTIAVVGGTTFGHPASFGKGLVEEEGSFTVDTTAGKSPPIYRMRYKGVPFYYIRMHGSEARDLSEKPGWHFVKTWVALYDLGVRHVFGGATGGSINTGYDFDDLVIVDDLILLGNQRPQNVIRAAGFDAAGSAGRRGIFANFIHPFCPQLRQVLIEECQKSYKGRIHLTATMIQDDPGRFETAAEIKMMRGMGADMVTHNVGTEAVYARQLGIRFAALNSVSNPAVGVRPFKYEDMQNSVARITSQSVPIILECVAKIPTLDNSDDPICDGERYEGSYTGKSAKPGVE